MEEKRPKVGVGVIVKRDGKVLIGKRLSKHGETTWGLPGGHLEFMESVEDCARRETKEETAMELGDIEVHLFTNDMFPDTQKHYITLFAVADWKAGEPEICEPAKCEVWEWRTWDDLPEPLFVPMQNLLKTGFDPFA